MSEIPVIVPRATPEEWVALACHRPTEHKVVKDMLYLHVIDGIMYATDGRRLHWAKTVFPDGSYTPDTFMPIKFPKENIPDYADIQTFENYDSVGLDEFKIRQIGSQKIECLCSSWGYKVNAELFSEALNGEIEGNVQYTSEKGSRFFGHSNFGAFIIRGIRNVPQ